MKLKLFLSSLLWIFTLTLEGILWIAGLLSVMMLAAMRKTHRVCNFDRTALVDGWRPNWAFIFGNLEDGVYGPWDSTHPSHREWVEKAKNWSLFHRAVSWYIRNPISNERFTKLGVFLDRSKMEWVGNSRHPWDSWKADPTKSYKCWARQGWRAGFWLVTKKGRTIRVGGKIFPGYSNEPERLIDRYQGLATLQNRRAHL